MVSPLRVAADCVDQLGKGAVPAKISDTYHGDFNAIKNNLNTLIDVVQVRNADVAKLVGAAAAGTDVRADASKYTGENGKLIREIDLMLDTLINPLRVAADYVDKISKGVIPSKITDNYNGDFNDIKNNLNTLIDVMVMRNGDVEKLIGAAVAGGSMSGPTPPSTGRERQVDP